MINNTSLPEISTKSESFSKKCLNRDDTAEFSFQSMSIYEIPLILTTHTDMFITVSVTFNLFSKGISARFV